MVNCFNILYEKCVKLQESSIFIKHVRNGTEAVSWSYFMIIYRYKVMGNYCLGLRPNLNGKTTIY